MVRHVGCLQGSLFINEANVTYSDDVSANGILHEVDTLLFPSSVSMDKDKESTLPVRIQYTAKYNKDWLLYR